MSRHVYSGERLKAARLAAGLQQEHVALAIGRGARQVAHYEAGTSIPSAEMLATLAATLGCSPADLFEVVEDEAVPA